MKIELISIGDEIVDGRQLDTNASWIGNQCLFSGHTLAHRQVVGDDKEAIASAFGLGLERSDVVISTGGLGPTSDDVTFEALAHALDVELEYHPDIEVRIRKRFEQRHSAYPTTNRKQAMLPKGAKPLDNERGTAPGLSVSQNQKQIFVFPGVPSEMKPMFDHHVRSLLSQASVHTWRLSFFGRAEAVMEEAIMKDLDDIEVLDQLRVSVTAKFPLVHFQFQTSLSNAHLEKDIFDVLFSKYSTHLWTFDKKSIEERIILTLKKKNWTLQTAESTSGGMVAAKLVDVPGCSKIFVQGLVTYANDAKVKLLGVSETTLETKGAVSKECALEMARGLRNLHGADVGISTTGIAGPDGGTPDKPVGTTFVGVSGPDFEDVKAFVFDRDRKANRTLTTYHALMLLAQHLQT